jgi:leader peptidase (prepilin peptidase)/N-methyltransferase
MEIILLIFAGLFGLTIGSFLNVVIYRLPRKIKFLTDRSICPNCSNKLKWYHNIPLFSYLFLRGKCGFCGNHISFRHPLVETINALFYLYYYYSFDLSFNFVVYSILTSVLIVIFFIDLDHQIIPDKITLPGIVIALAISWLPGGIGIIPSLIGFLVGGGSLYLVALLGDFLFKKESMGGGDIKMAAMLGALMGWQKIIFIFMSSAVIGLVISVFLMIFSKNLREQRVVPFGPFIALAAVLAIIYGDTIINYYLDNFIYSLQ